MKHYRTLKEQLENLYGLVVEELHPDLHKILNDDSPIHHKLRQFSAMVRKKIKGGEETGLESSKPKKGSSRAVFFPKDPHNVHIDGKPAQVHTVVKVAFPGHLDKWNHSGMLLGEHQNMTESDHLAQQSYGVLRHDGENNYKTNHDGVLPPLFDSHPENHFIHIGRVRPLRVNEFKELTKTPEFPNGITHDEMYHTLMHHHEQAHGRNYYQRPKNEAALSEHPLIRNMLDFVQTMGQHPGDYDKRNMGVFDHPHGSRHIVISDYGFSHAVAHEYQQARKNMAKAHWNNR